MRVITLDRAVDATIEAARAMSAVLDDHDDLGHIDLTPELWDDVERAAMRAFARHLYTRKPR